MNVKHVLIAASTLIGGVVIAHPAGQASAAVTCATSPAYHGSISAISGTSLPATLTVTTDHCGVVTVNVSSTTTLYRRFYGVSELDEYSTGDVVTIVGTHTSATTFDATKVHNISIQAAYSRVTGMVSAVTASQVTLQVNYTRTGRNTIMKGQSVVLPISAITKFITGYGKNIKVTSGVSDATTLVSTGSHITALGVWNRTNQSFKETWRLRVLKH